MSEPICEICKYYKAIGFIQYYFRDTGTSIDDYMGPNVCSACAEAMCNDEDSVNIDGP